MNQFKDSSEDSNSLQRKCNAVTVSSAEESLAQRKTIMRGIGTIKQSEGFHFVTKRTPCLGRIPRKHFKGSTAGDMIPEVPFPAIDECWRLKVAEKRVLYDKYRVPVGGKEDSSSEAEDDAEYQESPANASIT